MSEHHESSLIKPNLASESKIQYQDLKKVDILPEGSHLFAIDLLIDDDKNMQCIFYSLDHEGIRRVVNKDKDYYIPELQRTATSLKAGEHLFFWST